MRSRSNLNFKVLVFKERENCNTWRKTPRSKAENQQQTQPTYDIDARIRIRATLMGGEREIRFLKKRDEGVKNTCTSFHIHFVWLFLLIDELLNERVERNSIIFIPVYCYS